MILIQFIVLSNASVFCLGVNSGVLLVNLTRMREKNITNDIVNISIKYRGQLELGDQDILNILFHSYPGWSPNFDEIERPSVEVANLSVCQSHSRREVCKNGYDLSLPLQKLILEEKI